MKPNPQLSQREQAQLSKFDRRRVNHLSPSALDRVIDGAKQSGAGAAPSENEIARFDEQHQQDPFDGGRLS
jgi:hypothetical protein